MVRLVLLRHGGLGLLHLLLSRVVRHHIVSDRDLLLAPRAVLILYPILFGTALSFDALSALGNGA